MGDGISYRGVGECVTTFAFESFMQLRMSGTALGSSGPSVARACAASTPNNRRHACRTCT